MRRELSLSRWAETWKWTPLPSSPYSIFKGPWGLIEQLLNNWGSSIKPKLIYCFFCFFFVLQRMSLNFPPPVPSLAQSAEMYWFVHGCWVLLYFNVNYDEWSGIEKSAYESFFLLWNHFIHCGPAWDYIMPLYHMLCSVVPFLLPPPPLQRKVWVMCGRHLTW